MIMLACGYTVSTAAAYPTAMAFERLLVGARGSVPEPFRSIGAHFLSSFFAFLRTSP